MINNIEKIDIKDDARLMREIRAGNMLAFDTMYNSYSKKIYKFAYSILKSREESENIVQDTFMKLWEKRENVEKDSSVKSYLFTIAYNSTIDLIRKKIKDDQFIEYLKSIQVTYENPDIDYEYKELTEKLHKVIEQLPLRQKEVYLLYSEEGLSYQKIAEKLHISVNTVENHMSRALKNIRAKMDAYTLISLLFLYLFVY